MSNQIAIIASSGFSFNILNDLHAMLNYSFMQHAFEAGTIVAVVAGVVGYFVVLRRLSFAAHALSHAGFAGAAGAVLLGLNPLLGLLVFTSSGGLGMAALGRKAASRDVQIGTVLSFMLGLGVLFISLYKGYATEAYSLLFGEILGISSGDVVVTLIAGIVTLSAVALLYRRLLFTSLDEDVAEAKGVSITGTGVICVRRTAGNMDRTFCVLLHPVSRQLLHYESGVLSVPWRPWTASTATSHMMTCT
jgi:zinc/manganese transport system permease protein